MEESAKHVPHVQHAQHDEVQDVHVVDHNGRQISGGSWVCCMPCYWLRTNSSLHKASLTVVTLLVTSLLVASPVLFLISSVPANEQPYKDCSNPVGINDDDDCFGEKVQDFSTNVCDTPECRDIARRIQYSVAWENDPCKDFYKYACGGWIEAQKTNNRRPRPILAMDLSFSTIQTTVNLQLQQLLSLNATSGIFKNLGAFYSSCLTSFNKPVDTSAMYTVIDRLGGYLPPGSLGPNDITPLVASILKVNGAPLFDISLDKDARNKSQYSIIIDLPRDLPNHKTFVMDDYADADSFKYHNLAGEQIFSARNRRDVRKQGIYYTFIKEKFLEKKLLSLERVVSGMLPRGMATREKATDIQQILLFATAAEQLLPRPKELRELLLDPANNQPYTVDKLQETFPFINWNNLFKEIWPNKWNSNINIYVISKPYLQSVSSMISRFQKRVIQNALLALYARDYLYVIANHTSATDDKYQFCTHVTTKLFDQAVSALFLSQYSRQYLKDIEKRAGALFGELRQALLQRVGQARWLEEQPREAALSRLKAMTPALIAWPQLHNLTYLETLLSEILVTDDFFDNVVSRYLETRRTQMDVIDHPTSDLSWPYPFVVNAYYDTDDNIVVVPLALLSQPHLSPGVPSYVSYGTVGHMLAHEMLHAVDASSPGGSSSPAWAHSPALLGRLACLAQHYHKGASRSFRVMGRDMKVEFDGNATLSENAADVSGLRVAWSAWRALPPSSAGAPLPPMPLSPDKLFHLALAQLYCTDLSAEDYAMAVEMDFHMTPPERVNGLFRNSATFAEVFQCPASSPMNPGHKCVIW